MSSSRQSLQGRRQRDRQLVDACLNGSQEAWAELIDRYQRLIYTIPVRLGLERDAADEVFQAVCLKLFENLQGLRSVNALSSWLTVTTRRECFRATRRPAESLADSPETLDSVADDDPSVAETLLRIEAEQTLSLALGALDSRCRDLLDALYVRDPPLSYADAARALGRPIGSLGPTRSRCLEKLRRIYLEISGTEEWPIDVSDPPPGSSDRT